MKLLRSNPYLADRATRRAMFIRTVISSSAIEGVILRARDFEDTTSSTTRRGLERPQREAHNLGQVGSTPTAATTLIPGGA